MAQATKDIPWCLHSAYQANIHNSPSRTLDGKANGYRQANDTQILSMLQKTAGCSDKFREKQYMNLQLHISCMVTNEAERLYNR